MTVNLLGGRADAEPDGAPGAEGGGLLRDREVQAELPARRRVRPRPRQAGRGGQVRLGQVSSVWKEHSLILSINYRVTHVLVEPGLG